MWVVTQNNIASLCKKNASTILRRKISTNFDSLRVNCYDLENSRISSQEHENVGQVFLYDAFEDNAAVMGLSDTIAIFDKSRVSSKITFKTVAYAQIVDTDLRFLE